MTGRRVVLLCAVALALFSALFSLAAWYDWWPRLPPGALHDTDLWAGMLGGLLLLYCLARAKDTVPVSADPEENALKADAAASSSLL
jgi:hypothetical protein